MNDHKPTETGYTGKCIRYADNYEVRPRVYQIKKLNNLTRWDPKLKWDVFHDGVLVVEATSLRLAEEFIGLKSVGARR